MESNLRVLFYDIEITPMLGWAYDMYETNIIHVEKEPHIMCFAYKWLGDKKVNVVSQTDYDSFQTDPDDDYQVVLKLRELLDEADIVVAHNGVRFDNKVANDRFLANGIEPPSPYRTIDTYQAAKQILKHGSKSLDALCRRYGIGGKADKKHSVLWHDCVNGNKKAWAEMIKYCHDDVELLEGIYYKLRPFMKNHPNLTVANGNAVCPRCQSKNIQYRGYAYTNVGTYRRIQCNDCGSWSQSRLSEKGVRRPNFK